jgi:hypothetical protein
MSKNQGHHIIASSNVVPYTQRTGNAIVNQMLTVSDEVLKSYGIKHMGENSLTSAQTSLLRAFVKTGQANTWEVQRDIAQKALEKVGLNTTIAQAWASKAYEQMVQLFPNGPPRTPYK